ncbi:hypothetical protein ACLOJK_017551 [Asimina triloba]
MPRFFIHVTRANLTCGPSIVYNRIFYTCHSYESQFLENPNIECRCLLRQGHKILSVDESYLIFGLAPAFPYTRPNSMAFQCQVGHTRPICPQSGPIVGPSKKGFLSTNVIRGTHQLESLEQKYTDACEHHSYRIFCRLQTAKYCAEHVEAYIIGVDRRLFSWPAARVDTAVENMIGKIDWQETARGVARVSIRNSFRDV